MMIKLKKPVMVLSAAVAVFLFLIYLIFYAPLFRAAAKKCLECKSAEERLLEARKIIEYAGGPGRAQGREMMPESDAARAIDELTKYCAVMGINVHSMKPGEITGSDRPEYKILPVAIDLDSTYQKFAIFTGSLADFKKGVIKVKSFDMAGLEGDARKIAARLGIEIYLRSSDTETAAIPPPRRAERTRFTSWGRNPFLTRISLTDAGLAGILWDEKSPKAIIGGSIVGIGDKIGGNTVVDIQKDRVILNDGSENFEIGI
ncbi:MAG: hypothetical protein PHO42_02595 [Candidatus Omnitrophica bacterium]|nr:hypothetical protein [Candidatus Omnitrophota bacterium]